ncbi:DNA topoisomerase I [Methanobacterium alkalithermotolerans]|uniref:DNA topoisomerase 1 n=1 Tax=Methanobacterium alkalithermotolerans TaxID=2731220 RepID=A0A8T8KE46_9EURY|nr:DNA topoisomerase I [Methanobacterium alkalithermotolerans]QUH23621.1 DNA topoisomerase I [Methanobacterium alkalithermotolerans]
MHEVIICEKPKSSEKIAQALSPHAEKKTYKKVAYWEFEEEGKKTTVLSAVGHLYSLKPLNSKNEHFFDLEWIPLYDIDKKKSYVKDYVNAIKKFGKGADIFIHACDYDIEGTLIGYNALKYICGDKSVENALRMKFSTLTKEDVLNAYHKPIDLDFNQVDSGIARHVLDFIFGVNISKALMKSVRESTSRFIKLSAGRVQTPTLSILVDREKEIREFVPVPYWMIKALLEEGIVADNKKGKIWDKKEAEAVLSNCKGNDAVVDHIKLLNTTKKPPFPFDLGSLQSEAYGVFGFSPKRTQQIAQNLYTEGYTSYPRTSSQKLPKSIGYEGILEKLSKDSAFKKQIKKLPTPLKPNEGKKKDEAHPSIHPTGVLPKKLSTDDRKLYELIVYRFISVFGEDATLETMKTELKIGEEDFLFRRKRISYMGWLEHYPFRKVENDEFPDIKKGDRLKVKKIRSEEKETKPPARYNEASLIRELEKRGLGTKSTRADIIAILYDRKYIYGKQITVNQLGENIIDTLREYSPQITSEELTRQFENELQEIMAAEITKEKVIDDAKKEVISILEDVEKSKLKIGQKIYDAYQESRIVGECKCKGNLVLKYSPRNKSTFVGCSNYPDCKATYSLPRGASVLKTTCEKCSLPLISFGKPRQRACLDPKCGQDGKETKPEVVGKCPECGKQLLKRSGRYGEFIGCSGFPKCRFTQSLEEKEANKSG